jgi:hypothetical protein
VLDQKCSVQLVEVLSAEAKHIAGSKEGSSWDFWTQTAYAHTPEGEVYPVPIEIMLTGNGQVVSKVDAYQPGLYVIGAGTIRSGRRGMLLDFSAHRMVPVSEAVQQLQKVAAGIAGAAPRPVPVARAG